MAQKGNTIITPVFDSEVIDSDRTDGYWVETFLFDNNDKVPGVITYEPIPSRLLQATNCS